MNLSRVVSRGAAAVVAGVAGYASYEHIVSVARRAGESTSVSALLPLAIDGLIVVATLAILEDKRAGRVPRASARWALVFGVVATLAANIASAQPTWTARAVAAVPAISFLIAVEVLSRSGRPLAGTVTAAPVEPVAERLTEPLPEPPVEPLSEPPVEPVREPVTRPRRQARRPRPAGKQPTVAERVTTAHNANPNATHERIAELADTSVATVKRYRPPRTPGPVQKTARDQRVEPVAEPPRKPLPEPAVEPRPEPVLEPVA